MGLDMYLSKKTYLKNWEHDKENNYSVTARNNGKQIKHIQKKRVSYVIEEVGYWRKDNHIHQWFVANCQDGEDDCREAYVTDEHLNELKQLCKQVKDYLDTCEKVYDKVHTDYYILDVDKEVMAQTLPTASGFLFGGTEYDRWYYESLQNTIDIIDDAFKGVDTKGWGVEYAYRSSW